MYGYLLTTRMSTRVDAAAEVGVLQRCVHLPTYFGHLFYASLYSQHGVLFVSDDTNATVLIIGKPPDRASRRWSRSMYGYLLATDYACLGLASSATAQL